MDFSWTQEQDKIYHGILSVVQNTLHLRDRKPGQSWTDEMLRDIIASELGL